LTIVAVNGALIAEKKVGSAGCASPVMPNSEMPPPPSPPGAPDDCRAAARRHRSRAAIAARTAGDDGAGAVGDCHGPAPLTADHAKTAPGADAVAAAAATIFKARQEGFRGGACTCGRDGARGARAALHPAFVHDRPDFGAACSLAAKLYRHTAIAAACTGRGGGPAKGCATHSAGDDPGHIVGERADSEQMKADAAGAGKTRERGRAGRADRAA
jgi:hypothetical protein